jgi:isopentenyl diphosphate isomerase/L-lactate dehydrogenase-like FMN-dependent dehydrogenase
VQDGDPEFLTLHEMVIAARARLDKGVWDYLVGGTETETTSRRNRHAIESLALRPRVLRNVRSIDSTATLLGHPARLPVFLAPIGSLESFEASGGAGAAQAAASFGVPLMLSSVCNPGLEPVAAVAPSALRIYQLYVRGDHAWQDEVIRQVIEHGYAALAITVDSALYSRRERDLLNRFVKPWRDGASGLEHQAAFAWEDVRRIRERFPIPLILKGIMTAEDAVRLGVEGIYVSNHGGRQLDHGQGTLEVLPEIVEAVAGRAEVLIDGGFYRGTDVVKAIALGAAAVGLGRLLGVGMAAAGARGVVRVLELLEDEVRVCMGLLGVTGLEQLKRDHLVGTGPLGPCSFWSAFPLVTEGY